MTESQLFSSFNGILNTVFEKEQSVALTLISGESLFVKGRTHADLGSIPFAVKSALAYFKLNDGQSLLMNDPFSGGTLTSDITFIKGISLNRGSSADVILALRISLRPKLHIGEKFELSSFRVPPTPLSGFDGASTEDLLVAISEAPGCPEGFLAQSKLAIARLERLSSDVKEVFQTLFGGTPKKLLIEKYFKFSQSAHRSFLEDLPFDRASHTIQFDPKGTLQVEILNKTDGVHFDFSGTLLPQFLALTDPSVFGFCIGALNSFFDISLAVNQGHFQNINIHSNTQSKLNVGFPHSTEMGHLIAGPLVESAIAMALSKLVTKKAVAMTLPPVFLSAEFENTTLFERVASGTGASIHGPGEAGLELWRTASLSPSFEELEKRFPVLIIRSELREGSGGRGLQAGGDGMRRTYKFLKNAKVRWAFENPKTKAEGFQGGSAGDTAAIIHTKLNGDTVDLSSRGETLISEGETLTLLSSGGGGFGRVIE